MKQISSDFLKQAINEAINEMFGEAGPAPGPVGAQSPIGGGMAGPRPGGLGGMNGPKPGGGMNGPKPGGGMNGPKPGGAANAATPATPTGNGGVEGGALKDGSWLPNVEYAYYEKWWEDENPNTANGGNVSEDDECLKVGLNYIWNQHIMPLVQKWNADYSDILTAQKLFQPKGSPTAALIQLRVKPGKENEFIQIVNDLYKDIASLSETEGKFSKKTGQYEPTPGKCKYAVNLFPGSETLLIDYVKKAPSKTDVQAAEFRAAENWRELLSNMKDKNVLQKLRSNGGLVVTVDKATGAKYGHMLSDDNRNEMLAYPNATFVTQEWVWRDYYNREVIDPSQKIIITKPTSRKPSNPKAFEDACIACHYTGAREFRQKEKTLSRQQKWAVYAMYNKLNPADTHFGPVVVYDVANTRVIPGLPDIFNEEPGLANNITGVPNAKALASDPSLTVTTATNPSPVQADGSISEEGLQTISKIVGDLVHSETQTAVVSGGVPGDDIAENVYRLGKFLADSGQYNLAKPEYKEAFAQSLSAAVAATLGVPTLKGADFLERVLKNQGADMELKTMLILFIRKFKDFIGKINEQWQLVSKQFIKAKKNKKAAATPAAPAAAATAQPLAPTGTLEEDGLDGDEAGMPATIQPLSIAELEQVLNVPIRQIINTDENGFENVDEEPSMQSIQESFFSLLDRIELL